MGDEIARLFSDLETEILCSVAKRIQKMGGVSEYSEYQIEIARNLSEIRLDNKRILSGYDSRIRALIARNADDCVKKTCSEDLGFISESPDAMQNIMSGTLKKMADKGISEGSAKIRMLSGNMAKTLYSGCLRLTETIAKECERMFVEECNRAYLKVASGAYDYKTALKDGVDELARNGVRSISYNINDDTVTRSPESAVRMNIMTGMNQLSAEITEETCRLTGCEFVEVSAHLGARDKDGKNPWSNHARWQGKIYSLNGRKEINGTVYEDFKSTCGLGKADGICGINCRHSYYPYFPEIEPMYKKGEVEKWNSRKVSYEGKSFSRYEAEQKQRSIERKIRQYKKEAQVLDAGGNDSTDARRKIGEWQKIQRDFVKATGLVRDYSREYVGSAGGKQPRGKN